MKYDFCTTSENAVSLNEQFRPILINSGPHGIRHTIDTLLKAKPCIQPLDSIACQLRELVKARTPGQILSDEELDDGVLAITAESSLLEYGNWFYYPWAQKLVHLLPEKEFIELRTNRNKNKITSSEQTNLQNRSIGILGLSVGRSVALTLAQERVCGELRLADFDHLELSNLNRLRASVFEIEQNKAIITARAIAEMDPYLNVRCYTEGLNEKNLDSFFLEHGKLDLFIEECDGLDMKIKSRLKARELRIPVIMDTNDRGMLDIERFDLEPDRSILHGKIDDLDLSVLHSKMSTEEKVPFVASILGIDQMSPRMKASLIEVDQTLRSWPQLASSVAMGAALCTDVCRRILLDQHRTSGRWHIDIDELIPNEEAPRSLHKAIQAFIDSEELNEADLSARVLSYIEQQDGCHDSNFDQEEIESLVEAARHAPSGGNSQPWRFVAHEGALYLILDEHRSFSTIDPGSRYGIFALGACLENIRIQAHILDKGVDIEILEEQMNGIHAIIRSAPKKAPQLAYLSAFIDKRCTNRKAGSAIAIKPNVLSRLRRQEEGTQISTSFITGQDEIKTVAELCGRAERIRMLNPNCHWDMFEREMRWNRKEVEATKDGVDLDTLELSFSDQTGIRVARDPKAIALVNHWQGGKALEEFTEKTTKTSSALCIISVPHLTDSLCSQAGSVMQRIWLHCSKNSIAVQPISAPCFMGIHKNFDVDCILTEKEHRAAHSVFSQLKSTCAIAPDLTPIFILRLSIAEPASTRSLRRPLTHHLTILHPTHTNERPHKSHDTIVPSPR